MKADMGAQNGASVTDRSQEQVAVMFSCRGWEYSGGGISSSSADGPETASCFRCEGSSPAASVTTSVTLLHVEKKKAAVMRSTNSVFLKGPGFIYTSSPAGDFDREVI